MRKFNNPSNPSNGFTFHTVSGRSGIFRSLLALNTWAWRGIYICITSLVCINFKLWEKTLLSSFSVELKSTNTLKQHEMIFQIVPMFFWRSRLDLFFTKCAGMSVCQVFQRFFVKILIPKITSHYSRAHRVHVSVIILHYAV